jgi:N-acetylglutamate synthase-like GNAT family acetyltransferase
MIRRAAVSDARELAELTRELGYEADELVIARRLTNLASRDDQLVIVATAGDRLDGWLQAQVSETLESGLRVEIVGLIVADRSRRRGVGRELVAEAEEWARKKQIELLVVRSNQQRIESHEFYPALGFTLSKTQKVYRKQLAKRPNQAPEPTALIVTPPAAQEPRQ